MSHPRVVDQSDVLVIGHRWSPRVHELKTFLARSRVPYRWLDIERDGEARAIAEHAAPGAERYPVVLFPDGSVLVEPEVRQLAEKLGLDTQPDDRFYDLIIVGGGPAGLSASVYGASEGLRTVVVEREVPGGQASYSASIENYPGFPEGLSGSDLARRMVEQGLRFGVEVLVTRPATRLHADGRYHVITLDDATELAAHTVLLATGVSFRWLDAPGCQSLVGAGIYYGAAIAEASDFRGQDVYILGGGNSAGQAAMLLAVYARRVVILALEDSLEATMSKYLVDRIRNTPNITVRTSRTVAAAEGSGHLEALTIRNVETGETERVPAEGLFVFIGGAPRTEWLDGAVERDEEGFILSGIDLARSGPRPPDWPLERDPYLLETSMPGVFVAGDVRKGSVKRLASAVGEGAMAVQLIHSYCGER
jgi:thioredoxin reductase (NADPH)